MRSLVKKAVSGRLPGFAASRRRCVGVQRLPKVGKAFERLIEFAMVMLGAFGAAGKRSLVAWHVSALRKLYGREYMGIVRSTFLIDAEGRIVREWRNVRINNHVQQVLEAAAVLQSGADMEKAGSDGLPAFFDI